MKVWKGTGSCHNGLHETITLLTDSDSGEEEELLTITAEAAPPPQRCRVQEAAKPLPSILVPCITPASEGVRGTATSESGVSVSPTQDSDPGLPHHSTTTTTTTTTACTTTPCAAAVPPAQTAALMHRSQPQGTTLTHPTTRRRAVPASPGTARGTGGAVSSSQKGRHRVTCAPPSAHCTAKTVSKAPAPPPASHPRQGRGASTYKVGGSLANSRIFCTCCGVGLGAGDARTSLYLYSPLPHSKLSVPALLQCLSVSLPGGTTATSQVTLCQECLALLLKGDEAYSCLMQVKAGMRQRWSAVPPVSAAATTAGGTKRVRTILPKLSESQGTKATCYLCRAVPENWRTHAAVYHRLSPRWRSPRLVAALRLCLTEELQQGSGRGEVRRCPACPHTCPRRVDFVKHLRDHHRVAADHSLLTHQGKVKGVEQVVAERQQQDKGAAGLVKREVEEELEDEGEDQAWDEETVIVKEEVEEESAQETLHTTNEAAEDRDVMQGEEDGQPRRTMECVLKQDAMMEQNELGGNSVECGQEAGLSLGECPRRLEGGRRHGLVGQWRCRVCAATFTSRQDHDLHKAAAHPGSVRTGRNMARPDPSPSPPQRSAGAAGDHQNSEHTSAASRDAATITMEGEGSVKPAQDAPPQPGGGADLACGANVEVSDGKSALKQHQRRVHRRPAHQPQHTRCRLCHLECYTRAQLLQHTLNQHGVKVSVPRYKPRGPRLKARGPRLRPPPVLCSQCGKTYSAKYYDVHMANMHGDGNGDVALLQCKFCSMRFRSKQLLSAHMYLEHGNNTWKCNQCQLQFAKYHQLRQHKLYVHSNIEHRCQECPRSFKRRCDLTEHINRRHREQPPQECSFCHKVYRKRTELRKHLMKEHSVPWENTLAQGYARHQRMNNCLRRQRQQQASSPELPLHQQQQQAEESEAGEGVAVLEEEQTKYTVVEVTEAPQPLADTDTISYIIMEEA